MNTYGDGAGGGTRRAWGWSLALVACLTLTGAPAEAAFITVQPAAVTGDVGDRLDFDVLVGFESDDELVSAFDLDLAFDPTVLTFDGLVFGTGFGLLDDVNSGASLFEPGVVDFFVFSLLLDEELAELQRGGSVLLATLSFVGLAPGLSTVGVIDPSVDEFFLLTGRDFVDLTVSRNAIATATVTAPPVPVPEPATLALLGFGLLGVAGAGLRRPRS